MGQRITDSANFRVTCEIKICASLW